MQHDPATVEHDVRAALDKLASEGRADQIAEHLAGRNILGEPGCAQACAIANYVHAVSPQIVWVQVSKQAGVQYAHRGTRQCVLIELGQELIDFIDSFDRGYYPELTYLSPGPIR